MNSRRAHLRALQYTGSVLLCLAIAGCVHGVRQEVGTEALTPGGKDLSPYQRCRIAETSLRVPTSGKCDHLPGAPRPPAAR